ncbi:MAG TPA: hypothetical protein VFD44_02800, partial [Hanamia sp.]|nr:hypothetical protein [Hanamia sp.]
MKRHLKFRRSGTFSSLNNIVRKSLQLYKIFVLLSIFSFAKVNAQVIYQHDFGTTAITPYPYTDPPPIFDSHFSNSIWSNSTGQWT